MQSGLHDKTIETTFAGLSLAMVLAGWLLADLTYRRHRLSAEKMAEFANGAFYRLSFNKYHVDEAYDAAIVRPYMAMSRAMAWFDQHIIDGIVNLSAVIRCSGHGCRDFSTVTSSTAWSILQPTRRWPRADGCAVCKPVRSTVIYTEFLPR